MASPSTPPRRSRVHTPPAPLHGAQHDRWEPYTPRRSTRVAAQQGKYASTPTKASSSSQLTPATSHTVARDVRQTTPTPSTSVRPTKRKLKVTESVELSPPSSPRLSAQQSPSRPKSSTHARRLTSKLLEEGRDPFTLPQPNGPRSGGSVFSLSGSGIYPTPARTPRKRDVPRAAIQATARQLFGDRTATIEDAMPPPRRRRGKDVLEGWGEDFDMGDAENEDVQIYTDVKERRPEVDMSEDNPFITRTKGQSEPAQAMSPPKTRSKRKSKAQEEEERRMEEAVQRNEGLIYVFRGKKTFRPFTDHRHPTSPTPGRASSDSRLRVADSSPEIVNNRTQEFAEEYPISSAISRAAGSAAGRPLLRSSQRIARRLFADVETSTVNDKTSHSTIGENVTTTPTVADYAEDDEEALTDVDKETVRQYTESLRSASVSFSVSGLNSSHSTALTQPDPSPAKLQPQPKTRVSPRTRRTTRKISLEQEPEAGAEADDERTMPTTRKSRRSKKTISIFDDSAVLASEPDPDAMDVESQPVDAPPSTSAAPKPADQTPGNAEIAPAHGTVEKLQSARTRNESPFNRWRRTKRGASTTPDVKRKIAGLDGQADEPEAALSVPVKRELDEGVSMERKRARG